MNIVLTGATGYLGSHLASAFVADGHEVTILKRRNSSLRRLMGLQDSLHSYDLDGLDLAEPFQARGPIDVVVHTATCYGRAGESATEVSAANTAFPLRLLEAAISCDTDTFVNTDTFFNTNAILYPHLNAYALSKKHFADWGRQLSADGTIRFVNVRLEHLYGPGDDASKFATWIVKQCLDNVPEIQLTAGEQRRDFINIADAVSAYQTVLPASGALASGFIEIGLGSGVPISVRDFVETAHRLSGSASQLRFGALPYRENEQMHSAADISGLAALGWHCRTGLEEGIRAMIGVLRQ
jgi:CDP-paratose synthetase